MVVVSLVVLGNSEVHIWLLFLLIPFTCLLSVEAMRELKTEGKRQGYLLDSNFIFGFMSIIWCGMFSWTSRNSHVSHDKVLKYIIESFSVIANLRFVVCSVSMFSCGCLVHDSACIWLFPPAAERKGHFSLGGKHLLRKNLSLVPENSSF